MLGHGRCLESRICIRQNALVQHQRRSAGQDSERAPQHQQAVHEINDLVAVSADEDERRKLRLQCTAIKRSASTVKFAPPTKNVKRTARGVILAAEPGPSGSRNADIASIDRLEGGPAALRSWIGIW